jgi:nicotinate-nucleotide pyrophosphorylase (carboxylating)
MIINSYVSEDFLDFVLKEDLGRGDLTTSFIALNKKIESLAIIKTKQELVICGTDLISRIFLKIDKSLKINIKVKDGEFLQKGQEIAEISGNALSILSGERVVLNFLQRMSGVSTLTKQYVELIDENSKTKIVDTRKTTPGWRSLEKYAVKIGGAHNHRFGLDDGIMIKDNHIEMAGGIKNAVALIRSQVHHLLKIEVETTTLEEVKEALDAKADVIMLDNMDNESVKKAIKLINKQAIIEVSGGITKERIPELSKLNPDFISIGALTHSATAVDINLTLKLIQK